jgi:hypothetical protein
MGTSAFNELLSEDIKFSILDSLTYRMEKAKIVMCIMSAEI